MNLRIDKDWLRQHLLADELHYANAGELPWVPESSPQKAKQTVARGAFATLVQLWRIERGMTVQELAYAASIDIDEVEKIETDEDYRPEPQTVCALATLLKLPELRLLQLTGNVIELDPDLQEYSLKFAANAKQWQQISKEQRRELHRFMKILSER